MNTDIRTIDTVSADSLPAKWVVPPRNQGQIVEISYGDSCDGRGWKRVLDRSDGSESYYVCDLSECGCEGECSCWEPWNREPRSFGWEAIVVEGTGADKDDVTSWDAVASYVHDYGDGACDVRVEVGEAGGAWYVRTDDDAGGGDDCDDTAYPTRRDAVMAAEEHAAENDDGLGGEDAEGYTSRRLEETRGKPDPRGEWCCYWVSVLDDAGPRERYATQEQAEAAAEIANAGLRANNPGSLLCGYEARQLVDGRWVAIDDE